MTSQETPTSPAALALDGKTYRGSRKRGGDRCHVLTAVFHRIGSTLGEVSVDDKPNEIPVAEELLGQLCLQGRVVTMDALLTQRVIAEVMVENGGDDVMPVKDDHEAARKELRLLFRRPQALAVSLLSAETVEKNRGRVEVCRSASTSTRTAGGEPFVK